MVLVTFAETKVTRRAGAKPLNKIQKLDNLIFLLLSFIAISARCGASNEHNGSCPPEKFGKPIFHRQVQRKQNHLFVGASK